MRPVIVYVITEPGYDREFVSTIAPAPDRLARIRARGGEVYRAELYLPREPRAVELDPAPVRRVGQCGCGVFA